jgi:ubiquitin conjugation factor E4 B
VEYRKLLLIDLFVFYPVQFYDKFNIRHNIAELLEYLWQVPSHRNAWRQVEPSSWNDILSLSLSLLVCTHMYVSVFDCWFKFIPFQIAKEEEKGVYLTFLNFLINDSIYLLDESLNKILELKELEAEMSNTAEWERRPAQERQERTRLFHSQENVSLTFFFYDIHNTYVCIYMHKS